MGFRVDGLNHHHHHYHHHHHHHWLSKNCCLAGQCQPHSLIYVLIHSDHVFLGFPFPLGPGSGRSVTWLITCCNYFWRCIKDCWVILNPQMSKNSGFWLFCQKASTGVISVLPYMLIGVTFRVCRTWASEAWFFGHCRFPSRWKWVKKLVLSYFLGKFQLESHGTWLISLLQLLLEGCKNKAEETLPPPPPQKKKKKKKNGKIWHILPCPHYSMYSSGWTLSILGTNHHWHERMCHA